jgi:nitrite reductase/ring-hydroxylating ferredoxin subunit
MTERWLPVSTTDEVGDRGKVFTYPDGPFEESGILVRVGGEIVAWKNLCRHLAVRLDRDLPGSVMDREGRHLVCGQHGAVFQAEDGLCIAGPCAGSHLKSLKVRVSDGRVQLDLSALGGLHAAPLPEGAA